MRRFKRIRYPFLRVKRYLRNRDREKRATPTILMSEAARELNEAYSLLNFVSGELAVDYATYRINAVNALIEILRGEPRNRKKLKFIWLEGGRGSHVDNKVAG